MVITSNVLKTSIDDLQASLLLPYIVSWHIYVGNRWESKSLGR